MYLSSCLPAYLPTSLPTHLPTSLSTYLPTKLPTTYPTPCLEVCPPTCPPTHLPTYLSACLPTYLHAYLPTYLPTYLPAYLPTHLHFSLLLWQHPGHDDRLGSAHRKLLSNSCVWFGSVATDPSPSDPGPSASLRGAVRCSLRLHLTATAPRTPLRPRVSPLPAALSHPQPLPLSYPSQPCLPNQVCPPHRVSPPLLVDLSTSFLCSSLLLASCVSLCSQELSNAGEAASPFAATPNLSAHPLPHTRLYPPPHQLLSSWSGVNT